jgi:serine protease
MPRSAAPSLPTKHRWHLPAALSLAALLAFPIAGGSARAAVVPIAGGSEGGGGGAVGGGGVPANPRPLVDPYAAWRGEAYAADEILIQFRDTATPSDRSRAAREEGATFERDVTPAGLVKLRLAPGDRVESAIGRWNRRPDVAYATVNLKAHAFGAFDDSLIVKDDANWDWNLDRVHAFEAWEVQTGDPRVILAIIDSGVAHEDRAIPEYEKANLWPGVTTYRRSPELPGPFVPGWDFIHDDPYADDDYGHGTQVATIAAGAANNLAGSAGIAFGVTIMPIKVLDFQGDSDISYFVQGIRFAADHGANVANMSFGFPPLSFFRDFLQVPANVLADMFRPLREAVNYAQNRGVILVAAAGNFDANEVSLPADYPGVISVGATRPDDLRSSYSSYGKGLDFVAPGGDFTSIVTGLPQDQLFNLSIKPNRSPGSRAKPDSFGVFPFFGTSGASPHVAGAVALLLSKGYSSQGSIEQTLRETALIPAGPANGLNLEYGGGLVQLGAALRAKGPPGRATETSPSLPDAGARLASENPARGAAALAFRVPRDGRVRVRVFDVRGALVRTLEDRVLPAGERRVDWDGARENGARVPAGIYLFRVETPGGVETRKFAIVR